MLKQWWHSLKINSILFCPIGFFHGKIIEKCRKGQMSLGSCRKATEIPNLRIVRYLSSLLLLEVVSKWYYVTPRKLAKLSMYLINYELKRYNEEMDLKISVSSQTSLFYAFHVHVQ